MTWFAIFLGGGAGAVCRYSISRLVGERSTGPFPLATLLINVTGCFALGVVASLVTSSSPHTTILIGLLATGFLGGYTTFSTYALEGVILYADRSRQVALFSLTAPIVLGALAAGAGALCAHLAQGV